MCMILLCMWLTFILWKTSKQRNTKDTSSDQQKLPAGDLGEIQACSAIIRGDLEGLNKEDLSRLLKKRRRVTLPESFYLNSAKDCSAYIKDRGFLTVALSEEERDFPIAYSMVIHDQIEMFERLLRAVYTPQNVYCVHVDKKSPENFMMAVEAIVSCFPNVFVASKLERLVYASWSRVQADLNCMNDLVDSTVEWKYLINTCGTDFPIKTNTEMVRALKVLNGKNSIESVATPERKKARWKYHYNVTESGVIRTSIKKSPPPISTPIFSGIAYFVLSREFVGHLFKSPEAKALMEWQKDTYSPDEHLWASLQRMPGMPGSSPPNNKYNKTNIYSKARLVKWVYHGGDVRKGALYPRCHGVYRRSVCVYGAGDLNWILRHQHLFANKFDLEVDEIAIKCLEHFLRYKTLTGQSLQFAEKPHIMKSPVILPVPPALVVLNKLHNPAFPVSSDIP
ncbi:beta-1,3-galactosyl-O-glycosyl-glycoprotein beta-1,6-N-acetylglucosaminyltransferase 3-like [Clupea harengus]|uniref:Beta-1,3-galactosyl-O-glycosyl-glycoprotein beta-1,6-N-acetylglucosaminyltransferase 3 n=1 Tax=Clupea harengus TaxID=7950 RepID=A0A6P8GR68_CLUHA|nr:beta-1,3-galactosyl-O-glycosyl-glycoprotein beta-1,6-N-acetylglucosaminyltransferase 3-like [Clupea harengus]